MISQSMQDAFNAQIQAEMYSANLYLAMAVYCETLNLRGFAKWLRIQAKEEHEHALKIVDYLGERDGRARIGALEQPPEEFGSPRGVFEKTLAHEQQVTAKVHRLYELALAEKDYAAQAFLQFYVTEQVEEEARAREIFEKLRMVGDASKAVWWVDKELGKRGE
jgi:ferritin